MPSYWMMAAVGGSFLVAALFFSWLAVSMVKLRRSAHHRANIQQQIVLMLELVCQELHIDLGHVASRSAKLTDSGDRL
jgi:hypothetical protein